MSPMPEKQKKKEVNTYEVLGETRQLLTPSTTPSVVGSRFVTIGAEEKDRIDKMASEDKADEVNRGRESDSEDDYLDFSKPDYSLRPAPPPVS